MFPTAKNYNTRRIDVIGCNALLPQVIWKRRLLCIGLFLLGEHLFY